MAALDMEVSTVGDEGPDSMDVAAEDLHGQNGETCAGLAVMDTGGDAKARTSPTTISEIPPFQPQRTTAEFPPAEPGIGAAGSGTTADAAATALLSMAAGPLGDAAQVKPGNR